MEPFRKLKGIVVPLDKVNVDTDQIIPKQFLKLIQKSGYGDYLFYDWRYDENGKPKKEFVLNQERYKHAKILLARKNFGCGSSREHAVWALTDFGIKVIIAPSFAEIFYNNAFKNGLLLITLPEQVVDELFNEVYKNEGYELYIDLEEQKITKPNGNEIKFKIDKFKKTCLLEGIDEITLTMKYEDYIKSYEEKVKNWQKVSK